MTRPASMTSSHRARRAWLAAVAMLALAPGFLSAQAPDAGEDIRGPKALVEIPQPQPPRVALWLGLGGGVLALALAALLWRRYRARRRLRSPAQIALASLTDLEAHGEEMAAEAFANLAANAVRQYIAERFGLAAPRRTTEEFLRELARDERSVIARESDHLRGFLKSCDLAKFAASPLTTGERGVLLQAARGFITATAAKPSGSESAAIQPGARPTVLPAAPVPNEKPKVAAP